MSRFKRSFLSPHQFYRSLYLNPLSDSPPEHKNERSRIASQVPGLHLCRGTSVVCDNVDVPKENKPPKYQPVAAAKGKDVEERVKLPLEEHRNAILGNEENSSEREALRPLTEGALGKSKSRTATSSLFQPSYEAEEKIALFAPSTPKHPLHVWEDPNCDAAPASSWSTLANRSLLCRPLPLDVGRCTCYIVREREEGMENTVVYSLYTDEGQGRQDRKLAVARHRRRAGRSEFVIALNGAGTLAKNEEGLLGRVRANLVGSRYFIWDQADSPECQLKGCRQLLGVVLFEPTVTTLTGTFRVMRAYVPKYQSTQIANAYQHEKNGLTKDWEENMGKVHLLCSRKPCYNRETKRYELDFRDRARRGTKIKTSMKNVQLTMEENGKQVILLLGKVGNSKYIMEYRFPLTGYQAFSICLASIDSKLCCSV